MLPPLPSTTPFWDPGGTPQAITPPSAWDRATIAGMDVPGAVTIESCDKVRRVDQKSSFGTDGATLTSGGYDPGEVTIRIRIWTQDHLAAYEQVLAAIHRKSPGKAPPQAVDVQHPGLAQLGIRSLYPMRLGILKPSAQKGVMESLWRFVEFVPANTVNVKLTPKHSTNLAKQSNTAYPVKAIDPPSTAKGAADP